MLKRLCNAFLLIAITVSAAGCWDSLDINDRDILTAVVVDKTDYGYAFYVEIPPISGGASSSKNKPSIVKSEGRTYVEARENLDRAMDKPIFLGAVQSVIFTDRFASHDIEEYVLRLRQISDYRKTVHVVVTTEDPEKLLSSETENAETIGFAVEQTISSLVYAGQLHHVSLMDVLDTLASPYKHYILPTIALINNEPSFTGFTVFSGGMKTGFIPVAETKSICFMLAKSPKMLYTIPYRDTQATAEVSLSKKGIKADYTDKKISFDMNLQFRAILLYPERDKPVTEMDMEVIRSTLQAMLEKEFSEMFVKSQTVYDYDCYELHTKFRIAYPEEYKRMDWAGEYRNASLNLSVSVDLSPAELVDYNPEKE